MIRPSEHCIILLRNAQASPSSGYARKIPDGRSAYIIEVPCFIVVAEHAISGTADLSGDVAQVRRKTLPLRRNRGTRFARVTFCQSGYEQPFAFFKSRWLKPDGQKIVEFDRSDQLQLHRLLLRSSCLGCQAKLSTKCAGKCLM